MVFEIPEKNVRYHIVSANAPRLQNCGSVTSRFHLSLIIAPLLRLSWLIFFFIIAIALVLRLCSLPTNFHSRPFIPWNKTEFPTHFASQPHTNFTTVGFGVLIALIPLLAQLKKGMMWLFRRLRHHHKIGSLERHRIYPFSLINFFTVSETQQ